MENTRHEYTAPQLRNVPLRIEHAICGSPGPGESEEISFEDWFFWGKE